MAWQKLGGLVLWKSDSLVWEVGWFPFYPTIVWILLNISTRSVFRRSSNIRIICLVEGGFGGGGGGGTYGSGDCLACRAEHRTGEPSRTLLLQPPRVILIWFFPSQCNRDEKRTRINWGEASNKKPNKTEMTNKTQRIKFNIIIHRLIHEW